MGEKHNTSNVLVKITSIHKIHLQALNEEILFRKKTRKKKQRSSLFCVVTHYHHLLVSYSLLQRRWDPNVAMGLQVSSFLQQLICFCWASASLFVWDRFHFSPSYPVKQRSEDLPSCLFFFCDSSQTQLCFKIRQQNLPKMRL